MANNISYLYTKSRKEFGRPCFFSDTAAEITMEIRPNDGLMKDYVHIEHQDRKTQYAPMYSEQEMNTERVTNELRSMNHSEGGWPKDVHYLDSDQTNRFKKKVEKDENYVLTVLALAEQMEHVILQNNALNIYEDYFSDVVSPPEIETPPGARSLNVYRDPASVKRTITSICWNPENDQKMAVSYTNTTFQGSKWSDSIDSYVWDIDYPQKPELTLRAKSHTCSVEYNPKDGHIVLGGCQNGQVVFWDTRRGSVPVESTTVDSSHTEACYCTMWILSKTNTECFTAAGDGVVAWWDIRKLNEPLEFVILDVTKKPEVERSRAHGATSMEYEMTMQTKFLIGTEQGSVVLGNRKGKTSQDKIGGVYLDAHTGPIYSIKRNPLGLKNFLTVGDYTARIYSEDIKDASILWTKQSQHQLFSGCWNHLRPSVFFVTTSAGTVEAWDLMFKQKDPTLTIKVTDEPLRSIRMHETGKLFATGSVEGAITLLEISDALCTSTKQEKSVFLAMFEREVRREKTLEAKYREMRAKSRAAPQSDMSEESTSANPFPAAKNEFDKHLQNFRTNEEKRKHRGLKVTPVESPPADEDNVSRTSIE